jgi:predicted nucleic acid-binding protein
VINKKFPNKISDLELFLYRTLFTVELVPTPTDDIEEEAKIRDVDDRPILRAAINANADVLITGDKDLLEADIANPHIVTPAEFLDI